MASRQANPWTVEEVQTYLTLVADDTVQIQLDGSTRNGRIFSNLSAQMSEHGYTRSSVQCREKLKKLKSEYRAMKDHNGRTGKQRKSWRWFDIMDAIYGHRPAANAREAGLDVSTILNSIVNDETVLAETQDPEDDQLSTNTDSTESLYPSSAPSPSLAPVPEIAPSSTPAPAASPRVDSTRKRKRGQETTASVIREMMEADAESLRLNLEQQERNRAHRERLMVMQQQADAAAREEQERLRREDAAAAREQEATLRRQEMAQANTFNDCLLGVLGELVRAVRARPDPTQTVREPTLD